MLPLGKIDCAVLVFDFHVIVNKKEVSPRTKPNIWKANLKDIIHSASSIEPDYPIETTWDVLIDLWIKFTTLHIIWTTPKDSRNPPLWFSKDVGNVHCKRRRMWKRFGLQYTDKTKSQYGRVPNIFSSTLWKFRRLYEEKLVKESIECPKCLYLYII